MKICERALNFVQIYSEEGEVRICGWTKDDYIGKLTEHSLYELYNGPLAMSIKERHIKGDYSLCNADACPYLARNEIEKHQVEIDKLPELPDSLYIGFERVCNYACTSCIIHNMMVENYGENFEENYKIIEERIREVLPKIKHLSASGCGELFASKRTLKLLSEWEPEAPISECSVILESNGSLFNEKNWKQIENLGKYYIHANITIMSFNEPIYQHLSGTTLPISKLIDNLKFVKKLREEGVINELELATVVQEKNFREMPEFARRCIEEFGADVVRLRPYEWWGECSRTEAWYKDVRITRNPFHAEYKKVMSDPYLKDPRVCDQSGGRDSDWASLEPLELEKLKLELVTYIATHGSEVLNKYKEQVKNYKEVYLYGLSNASKVLINVLRSDGVNVIGMVDKNYGGIEWEGIPTTFLQSDVCLDHNIPIIVTPIDRAEVIDKKLKFRKWNNTLLIRDLISDEELKKKLMDT